MRTYNYSKKFNIEDFYDSHERVLSNVKSSIKIEPNEVMCFTIGPIIYFLEIKKIKELWSKFTEMTLLEYNLDFNDFQKEIGDPFIFYIMKQVLGNKWNEAKYFYGFLELIYDIYEGK